MTPLRSLRAWLFGCRSNDGVFYCTRRRGHVGQHEAHTCGCLGDGRCSAGPVETWAR